ncbi:hypothetical protein U3516DRAFT_737393 [Neocallimastix sp. 'constans']
MNVYYGAYLKEINLNEVFDNTFNTNYNDKNAESNNTQEYEILNSSTPFNVNIKLKYDEISQGMGLICPRFNSIESQVTRNRRKQLPPDITTFDEIPNESIFYKTKKDENFIIFKNHDLIYLKNIETTPKIFHYDFEKAISNAEEKNCQKKNPNITLITNGKLLEF